MKKNIFDKFLLIGRILIVIIIVGVSIFGCKETPEHIITTNNYDSLELASFVEPDFPFITTSLDLRKFHNSFPRPNVVSRGIIVLLEDSTYACFDTDLLRWSASWSGDFISLTGMAQISYDDYFNKGNGIPQALGKPIAATGIYPGWEAGEPNWTDPREKIPENSPFAWGALNQDQGRYEGTYLQDDGTVISYRIGETKIMERPSAAKLNDVPMFIRQLQIGSHKEELFMHLAEVNNGMETVEESNYAYVFQSKERGIITAIGVMGKDAKDVKLRITDNKYLSAVFPKKRGKVNANLAVWKGPLENIKSFEEFLNQSEVKPLKIKKSKSSRKWPEKVYTGEVKAPDSASIVLDQLMLPVPNPWNRNVRVMDVDFYKNGKAMLVTFEGDVWKVEGIGTEYMTWSRYASGLNEPMSVRVVKNKVYVYDRLGITILEDRNRDGEADFYQNFSNIMPQSMVTREWASSLQVAPEGGFYITKGASLGGASAFGLATPYSGFQTGSGFDGTVLWISEDGKEMKTIATGLRGPYIGVNPKTGMIAASDQQGNYVPSTPVFIVNEGDFFGVPATAHQFDTSEITPPLLWLPHSVDPSGLGELWLNTKKMGPLNDQLIHISFGRPGLFRILIDDSGENLQGGANYLEGDYPSPTSKGAVNPKDGQAYFAGFNLWGSRSKGVSSFLRLRYVKDQPYLPPVNFRAGKQGVVLNFTEPLDANSVKNIGNYAVKRYNYVRSGSYGSGHYKLDGSEGEELLPVVKSYLSKDGKTLLLNIPNMERVDQMEIGYDLITENKDTIKDKFWFTLHNDQPIALKDFDFPGLIESELVLREDLSSIDNEDEQKATVLQGKQLFQSMGCVGCHSPGTTTKGMYGPPFQDLFGSVQEFEEGESRIADEPYLRESILDPGKQIVKGYSEEMPSYRGILDDTQIESLILYIKSLSK